MVRKYSLKPSVSVAPSNLILFQVVLSPVVEKSGGFGAQLSDDIRASNEQCAYNEQKNNIFHRILIPANLIPVLT